MSDFKSEAVFCFVVREYQIRLPGWIGKGDADEDFILVPFGEVTGPLAVGEDTDHFFELYLIGIVELGLCSVVVPDVEL